jgi:hypothetical protein
VAGSLAKELADNDIAAGADKGPLSAKSSPVGSAKEIARGGMRSLQTPKTTGMNTRTIVVSLINMEQTVATAKTAI